MFVSLTAFFIQFILFWRFASNPGQFCAFLLLHLLLDACFPPDEECDVMSLFNNKKGKQIKFCSCFVSLSFIWVEQRLSQIRRLLSAPSNRCVGIDLTWRWFSVAIFTQTPRLRLQGCHQAECASTIPLVNIVGVKIWPTGKIWPTSEVWTCAFSTTS